MHSPANFSVRRAVGLLLLAAGLVVVAYPFISVWRLGGEVLSMLPEGSEQSIDDRAAFALFDEDFVLATRTYPDVAAGDIEVVLVDAGFDQLYSSDRDAWLLKECCGQYDAALARVITDDSGVVVAELSVFDDDIQLSWAFISAMGVLLAVAGAVVAAPTSAPKRDAELIRERQVLQL